MPPPLPPTPEGHRVLVVEDHPAAAETFVDVVQSRGDRPRLARTVEEALAALAEEEFCYALLDQELPTHAGARPLSGGGERVLVAARKRDNRRNDSGFHLFSILAVSGYAEDPDFVSKVYDLGVDAFVSKGAPGNVLEKLLARIRTCLERAGRIDHEACAACALSREPKAPGASAPAAAAVHIVLDATRGKRRMGFLVNGQRRELQDAKFVVLLRLAAAHLRGAGSWSTKAALGMTRSPETPSRIAEAFRGLVPEGFPVIERDGRGSFRLHPDVVVGKVDWAALAAHPHESVKKIAESEMARASRA